MALMILVLIPAGFAPSGTRQLTACGMIFISAGRSGPGSPSISDGIDGANGLMIIFFPCL